MILVLLSGLLGFNIWLGLSYWLAGMLVLLLIFKDETPLTIKEKLWLFLTSLVWDNILLICFLHSLDINKDYLKNTGKMMVLFVKGGKLIIRDNGKKVDFEYNREG